MFKNQSKKVAAFTLAEVLITLLIIGVVASIVIPQIIQDTQNAELKTALKETFNSLSSVTRLLTIENGGTVKGLFTNTTVMRDLYANKMNIIGKCNADNALGNCWVNNIKWLNGNIYSSHYPSIKLSSGILLAIDSAYPNCDGLYSGLISPVSCGMFRVDVNGLKGPNIEGKDIFDFHVLPTIVVPRGGMYDSNHSCSGAGDYCAYSVINNQ